MVEDKALSQGVFARGWADTKLWLGSWWFWALEVFGAGTYAANKGNPWAALWAAAAIFVLLWIIATVSAPARQRNEARALAKSMLSSVLQVVGIKVKNTYARSKLTNVAMAAKYIHLTISSRNQTVHNCMIRLKSIKRLTEPEEVADYEGTIQLVTQQTWEQSIDLYPGLPINFDVLCCIEASGKLWFNLEPPKQNIPITLEGFFDPPGVYLLEYFLTSDDGGPPQAGHMKIDWTGGFVGLKADLA